MRKAIAVLLGLTLWSTAEAGGRARVSLLSPPSQVTAGESFQLAFLVRPEWPGRRRNLEPVVLASQGERVLSIPAVAAGGKDRYAATIRLPDSGEWRIRVDSRYCQTVMDPVTVRAQARTRAS